MTALDPKGLYDRVVASCAQNLRNAGYVRRRSSLRKTANGNIAIVEFQRSSKSNAEAILFTMNLGVICCQLIDGEAVSQGGPGILDAHIRQRVGMLMPDRPDKWWTIESKTDANSLVEEISSLLNREVVPYLDHFLNDEAFLVLWDSGQSPGLTETQRLRYLAKLKALKERAR